MTGFIVNAEFPFSRLIDGKTYRPLLPITIINPENGLDDFAWAIIDTGADRSTVPEYIAKRLYHDIKNTKAQCDIVNTVGSCIRVYKHTFSIKIHAMTLSGSNIVVGQPVIDIPKMLVDVVPVETENKSGEKVTTGFNQVLLGVDDFLGNYILTIDYPRKMFSLRQ